MSGNRCVATCCFLDVGLQRGGHSGSSNVIFLHSGARRKFPNVIVVDCAQQVETTLRLLDGRIRRINHIVISHNDDDHCGGLIELVNAYRGRVDYVWFLRDRPAREIRFYPALKRLRQAKAIKKMRRLGEERENVARYLYRSGQDPEGERLTLQLLYPLTVEEAIDPEYSGDKNAASALVRLQYRRSSIVFPGDAQIETLRRARDHFGKSDPITCSVLVVPHHGGKLAPRRPALEELQDLYTNVIRCDFAVVSVASDNADGHPFPEHIEALTKSGATVLCTEITHQCCVDLAEVEHGIIPAQAGIPQASDRNAGAAGIACAGTIVADIADTPLEPRRLEQHQNAVDAIDGKPLCR